MNNLAIHTVREPGWIIPFVKRYRQSLRPLAPIGGIGYRWLEPHSPNNPTDWHVLSLFPAPNEVYGGKHDGRKTVAGFEINVTKMIALYCTVEALCWHSPVRYNGDLDSPSVTIRGLSDGMPVWLRLFSVPPPDEAVALQIDASTGEHWSKSGIPQICG